MLARISANIVTMEYGFAGGMAGFLGAEASIRSIHLRLELASISPSHGVESASDLRDARTDEGMRVKTDMQQIGRIAMRQEGDRWNAYYALTNTMDGAIFLGSILMAAVADNAERKQSFIDLMRDIVSDIICEKAGIRPEWGGIESAPEHERAGSA